MKIGSEFHKELFCRSFMESYREYDPETLPWPDLDDESLKRLQAIPFWEKALDIEREAGVMVNAYAEMVDDPMLKEAIALQAKEESRHARLIKKLIDLYGISMPERPPVQLSSKIEPAFTNFGFEECLDSYFAFGLFAVVRETGNFPDQMFTIFDPILDEEARHIVFFVNWFTYIQHSCGMGFAPIRATKTLWHYGKALSNLIAAFTESDPSGTGFTATGASTFDLDITIEKFLAVCIRENERRMSKYDQRLLQPRLMPRITSVARNVLQLMPKFKQPTVQTPNLG